MATPDARLILGDCLDVLRTLEAGSVDAVVTDPPYCSGARKSADMVNRGGMSRGPRWKSKPLDCDQMTGVGFVWLMRHVAIECRRVLKPGGSFLCFIDWRQYPNLYGAIETANLRVHGMIVWDKCSMALGNGFRNQHELIIHAAKGTPRIYDRATPNVIRCKRLASSDKHPTEKPVDLIETLLGVVSPVGGLISDPFAGSGSTAEACLNTGRDFVGSESDPEYHALAESRLAAARRRPAEVPA